MMHVATALFLWNTTVKKPVLKERNRYIVKENVPYSIHKKTPQSARSIACGRKIVICQTTRIYTSRGNFNI